MKRLFNHRKVSTKKRRNEGLPPFDTVVTEFRENNRARNKHMTQKMKEMAMVNGKQMHGKKLKKRKGNEQRKNSIAKISSLSIRFKSIMVSILLLT